MGWGPATGAGAGAGRRVPYTLVRGGSAPSTLRRSRDGVIGGDGGASKGLEKSAGLGEGLGPASPTLASALGRRARGSGGGGKLPRGPARYHFHCKLRRDRVFLRFFLLGFSPLLRE